MASHPPNVIQNRPNVIRIRVDIVSASVYSMVMNNNRRPTEIYFTTTKSGQPRAYRVSRMQFRSFPMSYDEAKILVATEQAIDVGAPVWKMR